MTRVSERSELVICTRNRRDHVVEALAAVAAMSVIPRVVTIVDSSDAADTADAVGRFRSEKALPAVRYVHSKRGLAAQRNVAIANLDRFTEYVHFIDDDALVSSGYLGAILEAFESPGVIAVGGLVNQGPRPAPNAFCRLFLMDALQQGVVLRSGLGVICWAGELTQPVTDVSWLSGCAMSYHRSVFLRNRFESWMQGYSSMEDVFFSYRASELGRVVLARAASVVHECTPVARDSVLAAKRMETAHRLVFVLTFRRRGMSVAAYAWALAGTIGRDLLLGGLCGGMQDAVARLMGVRDGIRMWVAIARGRVRL
jgi:GT2 family glycosyltransferase